MSRSIDLAPQEWSLSRATCWFVGVAVLVAGCAAPAWPPESGSPHHFLMVSRTAETTLTMTFPACPGDSVKFGIAKDQDPDREVSTVSHSDVVKGEGPMLIEFTINPEALLRGSLHPDVAVSAESGNFVVPVGEVEDFGGVYVITDLGVNSIDLSEGVPPLGEAWLYTADGIRSVGSDQGLLAQARLEELICD